MPRFPQTYCSKCGNSFGPGDSGYSHCEDHRIPAQRFYTDGANKINMVAILRAARQFRRALPSRYNPIGNVRAGTTIQGSVQRAFDLAVTEQERRSESPLSAAADAVDAAFYAISKGVDDAVGRDAAIRAFHAGRPCVLATGGYHHVGALHAAGAINRGDSDMSYFLPPPRASMSVIEYATPHREYLVAVNAAGRRMLDAIERASRPVMMAAE